MIYAVNRLTKEHREVEERYSGGMRLPCRNPNLGKGWDYIQADADGWIEWTGGECPLPYGVKYDVRCASGSEGRQRNPEGDNWLHVHGDSNIIAYRPIIDQPASEEAQPWEPAAGEPARTSGGDCMVLAIDRKRNRAAIRWDDGELGVVKIEVIKQRTTPREQWLAAAEHAIESTTGEPAQSSHLEIIHDALASGELPTPEQTK